VAVDHVLNLNNTRMELVKMTWLVELLDDLKKVNQA